MSTADHRIDASLQKIADLSAQVEKHSKAQAAHAQAAADAAGRQADSTEVLARHLKSVAESAASSVASAKTAAWLAVFVAFAGAAGAVGTWVSAYYTGQMAKAATHCPPPPAPAPQSSD